MKRRLLYFHDWYLLFIKNLFCSITRNHGTGINRNVKLGNRNMKLGDLSFRKTKPEQQEFHEPLLQFPLLLNGLDTLCCANIFWTCDTWSSVIHRKKRVALLLSFQHLPFPMRLMPYNMKSMKQKLGFWKASELSRWRGDVMWALLPQLEVSHCSRSQ